MENPKVIFEGRPSWLHYASPLMVTASLVLASLQASHLGWFACATAVWIVLDRMSFYAKVTESRIVTRFGFIGRKTVEVNIKDIRSIDISQKPFQRLFGVGDLHLQTTSESVKEAEIVGVQDPITLRERIRTLKEAR